MALIKVEKEGRFIKFSRHRGQAEILEQEIKLDLKEQVFMNDDKQMGDTAIKKFFANIDLYHDMQFNDNGVLKVIAILKTIGYIPKAVKNIGTMFLAYYSDYEWMETWLGKPSLFMYLQKTSSFNTLNAYTVDREMRKKYSQLSAPMKKILDNIDKNCIDFDKIYENVEISLKNNSVSLGHSFCSPLLSAISYHEKSKIEQLFEISLKVEKTEDKSSRDKQFLIVEAFSSNEENIKGFNLEKVLTLCKNYGHEPKHLLNYLNRIETESAVAVRSGVIAIFDKYTSDNKLLQSYNYMKDLFENHEEMFLGHAPNYSNYYMGVSSHANTLVEIKAIKDITDEQKYQIICRAMNNGLVIESSNKGDLFNDYYDNIITVNRIISGFSETLELTEHNISQMQKSNRYLRVSDVRKVHDLNVKVYDELKTDSSYDIELFKSRINESLSYDDETSDFIFMTPKLPSEMSREGAVLGNCVKTYIERVLRNETQIVFLRDRKAPTEPLVVFEVNTRNEVCQLEGKSRRSATLEESNALRKYMKKKKLACTIEHRLVAEPIIKPPKKKKKIEVVEVVA